MYFIYVFYLLMQCCSLFVLSSGVQRREKDRSIKLVLGVVFNLEGPNKGSYDYFFIPFECCGAPQPWRICRVCCSSWVRVFTTSALFLLQNLEWTKGGLWSVVQQTHHAGPWGKDVTDYRRLARFARFTRLQRFICKSLK